MAELSPLAKLHAVSVRVSARYSGVRGSDIIELGAALDGVYKHPVRDLGADALIACAHWHHARGEAETAHLLKTACAIYSTLKIDNQTAAVRADLK